MSTSSVHVLHEGVFSVGLDKKFIRISKEDSPAKGALKIALNPFLIQTPNENILIDAGLGIFGEESHYEIMLSNLEKHQLSEHDISKVYCSHLHYDHIGGLAHDTNGYWQLTFPDATIYLSGKEWEKMKSLNDDEGPRADFIDFLEVRAELVFLDELDETNQYITTQTIGGHTEFSQLIEMKLNDQLFLMAGDVLGTRGAVNRRYAAKYDYDGKKSMKLREGILKRALDENAIIMAYHDTHHPMFKITDFDKDKGFIMEFIEEYNE